MSNQLRERFEKWWCDVGRHEFKGLRRSTARAIFIAGGEAWQASAREPAEECPQCHSRERRRLNEACQAKPFIHLKQYHAWHDELASAREQAEELPPQHDFFCDEPKCLGPCNCARKDWKPSARQHDAVYLGEVVDCPARSVIEERCICKAGWGHRSFRVASARETQPAPRDYMTEFDRLKGQKDAIVARGNDKITAPLQARVAELEHVIKWIASQQDLFFAECSQAEEIVARCKEVMAGCARETANPLLKLAQDALVIIEGLRLGTDWEIAPAIKAEMESWAERALAVLGPTANPPEEK